MDPQALSAIEIKTGRRRIISAQDQASGREDPRRRAERVVRNAYPFARGLLAVDWRVKGEVRAYVNHSRWHARCPHCAGIETVAPGQPFFCMSCHMALNGFRPAAVIFPEGWTEIEAVLLARPVEHRHWRPGESLDLLIAENIAHGLPARWEG